MADPLTPAQHREAAENHLSQGYTVSSMPYDPTQSDMAHALVRAVEEQTAALHALTHAVLSMGKVPDGAFAVLDRDDEG